MCPVCRLGGGGRSCTLRSVGSDRGAMIYDVPFKSYHITHFHHFLLLLSQW